MSYYLAIIYGMIQGLTEFLPVSSSGHLALLPFFINFKDPGVVFDLAMHLGTALSVLIYFHKDIIRIIKGIFSIRSSQVDYFAVSFVLATGVTGSISLIIKDIATDLGRTPIFIGINLIVFGVLLVASDKLCATEEDALQKKSGLIKALWIGVFQVLALFPGVSRSGITITTARFLNVSKREASSFSFLLSLPLIVAGGLLKSQELVGQGASFDPMKCLVGVIVSFAVGLLTIHYFLKLLQKIDFGIFMFYRIALALLIFYFI